MTSTYDREARRRDDPYRWLEGTEPVVQDWQAAQNDLATDLIRSLPQLPQMSAHVDTLYAGRPPLVPRHAAGSWWRVHDQRSVVRSEGPVGRGHVLVDLDVLDAGNEAATVSWVSPAPDGSVVALGLCRDGSEHNTIVLVDVATGALLPSPSQVLFDAWSGGAVWVPDSSSYWFVALAPDDDPRWMAVYRHVIGEAPPTRPERIGEGLDAFQDYLHVAVSRDGRWGVLSRRLAAPVPFAVRRLDDRAGEWRAFVTRDDCGITGHVVGDRYVAMTDLHAPRGRLVALPLEADDPDDDNCWEELVAEGQAVLRTVTRVGDHLYLSELVDTYSRVRVVDLEGRHLEEVPLPGRGALAEPHFPLLTLLPRGHDDELVFSFSTLTESWGSYRHRPGQGGLEVLAAPGVVLEGATVVDRFVRAADGVLLPYHVVLPPGHRDGPLPALVWGYGGFNIVTSPHFPGAMAAFVAAGGIFVHTHLRGGAEYGRDWWQAGRGINKQQTFDDLYAIAEDLILHGYTTRERLALTGGSNGGLLCGVAVTQRPELFRVVVPQVPILDLLGATRDPYGEATVREYADVDDPADLERMLSFSPYHLARLPADYPAVLVVAGDTDPRCPPWHARKWVARLQHSQQGSAPILLRVWPSVGHGLATPAETVKRQASEWLAFAAAQVGL